MKSQFIIIAYFMLSLLIINVYADEHGHLRAHVIAGIRDGDFAKIDVFESADKPFNHCNASMFAYRSITRFSA